MHQSFKLHREVNLHGIQKAFGNTETLSTTRMAARTFHIIAFGIFSFLQMTGKNKKNQDVLIKTATVCKVRFALSTFPPTQSVELLSYFNMY